MIKVVKSSNGLRVTNPMQIEEEITKNFILWFTSNMNCYFDENLDFDLITPIISHQENLDLIKEVSFEEIKKAVFDLPWIKPRF